ncbi:MAG: adenosylmethionine--8-amino-7-oxononanoate transaminase [Planctomycetes bacterium]|nr:adenosylmethionine--8-amino-7-oxononanoate transaminase [Planctomycetota bacterium]
MNKSAQYRKKDRKYIWHPFTQMKGWMDEDFPVIVRGSGCYLYDADGRKYLDGVSSLWCNVHGHCVKAIDDAVMAQLRKIAHSTMLGLSNAPAIGLAEKLIEIAPAGLKKVFFSDSGSESVEAALKIAYQYCRQSGGAKSRRKQYFISLKDAYHGDTLGAVSAGSIPLFHKVYGKLLFKTISAPSPHCYRCPCGKSRGKCSMECLEKFRSIIVKNKDRVAGVIMEPLVQGAAGIITHPSGFLKGVADACRENGVLLILDEVATGFGRTGRMFACGHEGVSPDILCVAKGITGGYLPLSATLTTEKIYKAFLGEYEDCRAFYHGHTFTGNPLACAAATASLKLFGKNKILRDLDGKIAYLKGALQEFYKIGIVGDVRQCGMMAGIELVRDRRTKEPFPMKDRLGHKVILEARKRGVILRPLGNVIVLMPPLSISMKELRVLVDVAFESIMKCQYCQKT